MTVDVRPEVLVHRPRGDVAAFMFDPAHDLEWTVVERALSHEGSAARHWTAVIRCSLTSVRSSG